jgi:hypothetical protein
MDKSVIESQMMQLSSHESLYRVSGFVPTNASGAPSEQIMIVYALCFCKVHASALGD